MTESEKRRESRLKTMQVKKTSLYSSENNSFCTNLSPLESWELLSRLSKELWFLEKGELAPNKLDKQKVKIFIREK